VNRDEEFRDFVLRHSPALLRSAHALVTDPALAEDLAQNALVRTYTAWARVRAADDPVRYAHQILFNSYRQLSRRRRIVEVFGVRLERPTEPPAYENRDQARRALAALPPGQRAVLVMRFLEDRSVEETAQVLGISAGTVKSQTAKALAHLRTSTQFDNTVES
jgi:RNA polymerase sigma-70 factor (sigma-E family)